MLSYSLLLLANISRYSWGTLEKILGIVLQELPRNWFGRIFLWKFPRISTNFDDIFSGFLTELVTRNSLELVTRNYLGKSYKNFTQNGLQEISRTWLREIPRNGLREIPWNSCWHFQLISRERFLGISADSKERFLWIFFFKIFTWGKYK